MQGTPLPVHKPVLLREMLEYMSPKGGEIFLDGTLGLGGAAAYAVKAIQPDGVFIGVDKDAESMEIAKNNLKDIKGETVFIHNDFRNIKQILAETGFPQVDKIFLDLGISSYQLALQFRGFSFETPGLLDMRMDQSRGITAGDIVNQWNETELADLIYQYGEERYSRRIARRIVHNRTVNRIETTSQLTEIIEEAVKGTGYRVKNKIHPATRTFQALRIAVNGELDSLKSILNDALDCLKVGGRIGIISFHSLEDRLVKTAFRNLAGDCTCGKIPELCQCPKIQRVKLMTKKPVIAKEDEVLINPRARSAKFRVAEKII